MKVWYLIYSIALEGWAAVIIGRALFHASIQVLKFVMTRFGVFCVEMDKLGASPAASSTLSRSVAGLSPCTLRSYSK